MADKKRKANRVASEDEPKENWRTRPKHNQSEYMKRFYLNGDINQPNQEEWDLLAWCCQQGMTDMQIANHIGVSRISVGRWKNEHTAFYQCLLDNKSIADDTIELMLYERAKGYDFVERKLFVSDGVIISEDVIKHIPPDVGAAKYWLQNRRPDRWKDVVHTNNINKEKPAFDTSSLSDKELEQLEMLLTKMGGASD